MPPQKKSGFKPCRDCERQMSITDPHKVCIWCLGSDHDVGGCRSCQAMNPKTLRERVAKLCLARQRGEKRKRPRRSRSPSQKRSSSKSSTRHRRHHRHRSHRESKEKEKSVERPPSDKEVESGEDLEEGELQIVEEAQGSDAESQGSPARRSPRCRRRPLG